ncbi:MAG: hypothetical protein ACO1RX_12980 [Candidatus Sericytochromatia bacterium]
MTPPKKSPIINWCCRWLLVFSCLGLSTVPALSAESPEYVEQVYLNEAQALKLVFKDLQIQKRALPLSAAQRGRVQKRLRRKLEESSYTLYSGSRNGKIERYAFIFDEQGKHFPITFIVALSPQARVEQVAVMIYRERRGDGVKRQRFLSQFVGKDSGDPMAVNTDIVHITGSTISSWSIAAGVRKAVVLLEELVIKP